MDKSHGSPHDRGYMDYYYGRLPSPHKYESKTYLSPRVTDLTDKEKTEYDAGWREAQRFGDRKEF